ncbi:replicative DNA helicase [Candidatus Berkelbacteria bacterium CG10_big_fil_rev_8_21_14_0_10_41_12]|uniref:Replicative DNA helicase n=1 Tax=Candidatus Berkelbacteria bacterium CG10_big_fil_rev_8_21_14_0_10_41_12 TaxID=1974513 RepID=A0A2M6WWJ8_9BACT|nr:MAG: replicative DNA helicase [Candidatus Berkelbacteria bacterium CG10_big_fil_rev_8_21_14_0_10_41_12]
MAEGKNEQTGKLPPQNVEAEQSIIGGLLIDKDAIFKVADIILPSDFYRPEHGIIFDAMVDLFNSGNPIDLVTLSDHLQKKKQLKKIGGATYLTELANSTSSSAYIAKHAKIVAEKSALRRLINAATSIIEEGYDATEDAPSIIDKAESRLFSVIERSTKDKFVPIKDILGESIERINEIHENRGQLRGMPSGFKQLDNLTAGFQKSDLVVLAARPGMGKTALALNIASNIAVKNNIPVGLFSLEMSRDQLVDRLLTLQAGIDSWRLRTGNLQEDDFPRLNYAMGVLSEAPIYIDDSPLLTALDIRTKARRLQAEIGLGMIVVDYLQLMEGRRRGSDENRVQEVSDISRSLKGLARELNIPILAISQLSRAVEARTPKIPQLSDLRESGSIEQDADVVMFIYREDYYEPDTEKKGITQILVRKHRNGPTGDIELYFHPEYSRFGDIEKSV